MNSLVSIEKYYYMTINKNKHLEALFMPIKIVITISLLLLLNPLALLAQRQNILMIVLDDLNITAIKAMGSHPQADTPHIDRLISEGMLFTNAHSNAPVCSPSRASFMTGIAPWISGEWGFSNWLNNALLKQHLTLGEYAQKNGYLALQTGKVLHNRRDSMWTETGIYSEYGPNAYNGKKAVPHPLAPPAMEPLGALDATFCSLAAIPDVKGDEDTPGYQGWYNTKNGADRGPFRYVDDGDRDELTDEKSARWLEEKLVALEAQNQSQPFFIGFGIIRPHTPMVVPQRYFDLFPIEDIQLPPRQLNDLEDVKVPRKFGKSRGQKTYHALASKYGTAEEGLKYYVQAYLACVKFADDIVGRALNALDKSSFRKNTTVLLFSDHGFGMGQKNELWKYTNWDEATHVPLVIKDPRYPASHGKKTDDPVSLIDIFPTIRDLAAWEGEHRRGGKGADLSGQSLVPYLKNVDYEPADPQAAVSITASWTSKKPRKQHLSAVSRGFRYIRYGDGSEELYDRHKDPFEWKNIADRPEMRSVVERHVQYLEDQVDEEIFKVALTNVKPPSGAKKSSGDSWKDKYFKKFPVADADGDGVLSWPEYHRHKKSKK